MTACDSSSKAAMLTWAYWSAGSDLEVITPGFKSWPTSCFWLKRAANQRLTFMVQTELLSKTMSWWFFCRSSNFHNNNSFCTNMVLFLFLQFSIIESIFYWIYVSIIIIHWFHQDSCSFSFIRASSCRTEREIKSEQNSLQRFNVFFSPDLQNPSGC